MELPGAATMRAAARASSAERVLETAFVSEERRFLRLVLCIPILRDHISFVARKGVAASYTSPEAPAWGIPIMCKAGEGDDMGTPACAAHLARFCASRVDPSLLVSDSGGVGQRGYTQDWGVPTAKSH